MKSILVRTIVGVEVFGNLISFLGSTHIITPDKFVEDLGKLDKVLPPPKSVVPVYSGSIHTASKSTTEKTPPPRTTSTLPPSHSSKSYKIFGKN